ncbi:MAG: hypothetical protein OEV28_08385 [Nitrospirota bacterium]|nr:hypothetical protein [Nitrospirota bacterium]
MATNAISSNQHTSSSGGQVTNPGAVLGKDDFLKMFVATLQNQDPISPVDSKEFLSQNAMFTELEKLANIESLLSQNQGIQKGLEKMLAANYLGQQITATIPPQNKDEVALSVSGRVVGTSYTGDTPMLLLDNGKSVAITNVTGVKLPGA